MRLFWMIKMAYKFINNYETKLTAQATAAATSITVANASGLSLAAGEVYRMTIQNADASLYELVDVTAISGNTLTIQRAKESTTAQVWPVDSVLLCGVTAAQLEALNNSGGGGGGGGEIELWHVASSSSINLANGNKQIFTASGNDAIILTIHDGADLTLIVNPVTYVMTMPSNIKWFGSAPIFTANKMHTFVISRNGSEYYGYWQVQS